MKNKTAFGLLAMSILLITSCNCVVDHKGFVLDSRTEKPITNATIKLNEKVFRSDSRGYFEIHYTSGLCSGRYFRVTKDQYKPETIIFEPENDELIYRVKSNTEDEIEENSLNFKVKGDTIFFYLTAK